LNLKKELIIFFTFSFYFETEILFLFLFTSLPFHEKQNFKIKTKFQIHSLAMNDKKVSNQDKDSHIRKAFDSIDVNHDGVLQASELHTAMTRAGVPLTAVQVEKNPQNMTYEQFKKLVLK
jgi:Ca2+-binding EF-hand superfamily protein